MADTDTRVAFDDANAYDEYMGRWSRAIGEKFLAWLDPPANRAKGERAIASSLRRASAQ